MAFGRRIVTRLSFAPPSKDRPSTFAERIGALGSDIDRINRDAATLAGIRV